MKEYTLSKERIAYVEKNLKRELAWRKYYPFLYKGFKESWVEVNRFNLKFSNLPKIFDGYKIVQISDIHMGTWMTEERLAGIVRIVNRQSADMIAYTGDLFSYGIDHYRDSLSKNLSKLKSKDGTIYVLGNHDYWNGHQKVREIAKQIGMVELTNQVIKIKRKDEKIFFTGTDSAYEDRYSLDTILDNIPSDSFSVILSHEPDTANFSAATGKFSLQLSGHSHGGQLILPFMNKPPIRVRLAHHYPLGLYKIKDMLLYTNRGLGTSIPPFRFNCKPEISVITLRYG